MYDENEDVKQNTHTYSAKSTTILKLFNEILLQLVVQKISLSFTKKFAFIGLCRKCDTFIACSKSLG